MKQLGKRIYNNNFFKYWGGKPPLYSNLTFYSKDRTGSVVNNKISPLVNGELLYNPLTDVIDLSKYTDRGTETNGSVEAGTLHIWETVTIPTIIDDVIDDLTFKIVKDFDDFQAVNNGLASTDYYIMSDNINCISSQTTNRTKTDAEVDSMAEWSIGTYTSGQMVKVQNDETGVYPIDDSEATTRYDVYIRTPYVGSVANDDVYTETDEPDTTGVNTKYWHIYNYTGFWINEFKGTFSGNGFELQNCYVNKTTQYAGVFMHVVSGKISNITVSSTIIGYNQSTGGLVGDVDNSIITNIGSNSNVIGYSVYIGGLCGSIRNGSILNNIYSTGDVIGYSFRTGGLSGVNYSSSEITNSYSTVNTKGYGAYVAGLIGENNSSKISNSYCTGVVNDNNNVGSYICLFCGRTTNSTIDSCYTQETSNTGWAFSDTTMGVTSSGIKTELLMKTQATFEGWDFANIWTIDDSYPYLRMENVSLANPISNSKIVNNYDGYIIMPADIEIETGKPLFNRDDTDIYNSDATSVETGYLGDGVGGESSYYWHISELNTDTILSYMNEAYKFSWFVKNTFCCGTYDAITVKEILAYDAPITNVDDLTKIMKYLKIDVWYDSQTWDDDIEWID